MSDAASEQATAPPQPSRWLPRGRRSARRQREYGSLMRLHRPIGKWLLLWPTLWAVWIAADGRPQPEVFAIFVLGTIVMRSAGCIVNDLADRDIDPHVKRTKDRPLAARRIDPREAIVLCVLLFAIALFLVTRLNELSLRLALIGAALALTYPFFKRFFPAPQFYLGLAFGWGVPLAFAATQNALPRVAWLLFIAAILWAVVYDTEYAMVDRSDDLRIGVKSTAILFGDLDRVWIAVLQLLMLVALLLVGRALAFATWYYLGLGVAALCFIWQQWLIRARAPQECFRAFNNNAVAGLAVLLGIVLEYLFRAS
ncbi:MAG: 4-hydroxybenzoate octaprenyltransferase [Steroidobacteraceae bacterium]|nr:4-hydroxybenzoate octaprenyltransferase [Steroidobacteraceae bacterium]MDW8260836.1 4-hydroxybenzoate octaprenyltransferase [Gammaproteobacteria bacterium]